MGGRASSVVDAVVSFLAAFFHRVLASVVSPSKPRDQQQQDQQKRDNSPEHNQPGTDTPQQDQQKQKQHQSHDPTNADATAIPRDGDGDPSPNPDADPQRMPPPLQTQAMAANRPDGPREIDANGQPPVHVALPTRGPPNGVVKQENVPTTANANGAAVKTANDGDLATNGTTESKFRAVGEEQAEENRQEYITLPPPVHSGNEGDGDEPEDPAKAAERAVHHGFMDQALDMVCLFISSRLLSFPIPVTTIITCHQLMLLAILFGVLLRCT